MTRDLDEKEAYLDAAKLDAKRSASAVQFGESMAASLEADAVKQWDKELEDVSCVLIVRRTLFATGAVATTR